MGQKQSKVKHTIYKLDKKIISIIFNNYSKIDNYDKLTRNSFLINIICSIITPITSLTKIQRMDVGDVLKSEFPSNYYYYRRYSVSKSTRYLNSCNKDKTTKCERCNSLMYLFREDGDDYSFPDNKYISEYFCSNTNCGLYYYYKYTPSCIIY